VGERLGRCCVGGRPEKMDSISISLAGIIIGINNRHPDTETPTSV